ncbi:hypothetical protein [Variovorax sp. GB1P17]
MTAKPNLISVALDERHPTRISIDKAVALARTADHHHKPAP